MAQPLIRWQDYDKAHRGKGRGRLDICGWHFGLQESAQRPIISDLQRGAGDACDNASCIVFCHVCFDEVPKRNGAMASLCSKEQSDAMGGARISCRQSLQIQGSGYCVSSMVCRVDFRDGHLL